MKIKIFLMAVAITIFMGLTSCSLTEDVDNFSEPSTFYKTRAQCESAVNQCYHPMKIIYTYAMMLATEATTDVAFAASGTLDASLDISPAHPQHGATVWTNAYWGIMICNSAIAHIEEAPISVDDRTELLGQAKVMRAMYYYVLTCFFGDVPYYTEDVATEEIQMKIANLPRMSAVETRDALIKELEAICPDLDQVRTSERPGHRAGAAMGYMLIAKMAMWNQEWDTAIKAIDKLEKIYGEFGQYPLTDTWFRYKNTPESIYEIQHTYTPGGLSYYSNVACICMPYFRKQGTSNYCGVDIPELGDEATTWSPMRPTQYMSGSLMYEHSGDLRDGYTILHDSYNGQKFSSPSAYGATGFFGPKFWCPGMSNTYDSNNYPIFRYADALLMKAECLCMKEVDSEKAVEYVNKIKRRAGISELHFRNWGKLFQEIIDERARELYGEFQRKFDLVRWGVWYERVRNYNNYTFLLDNIRPCHEYYPIPDTEVANSGYALDNNAYKACGL